MRRAKERMLVQKRREGKEEKIGKEELEKLQKIGEEVGKIIEKVDVPNEDEQQRALEQIPVNGGLKSLAEVKEIIHSSSDTLNRLRSLKRSALSTKTYYDIKIDNRVVLGISLYAKSIKSISVARGFEEYEIDYDGDEDFIGQDDFFNLPIINERTGEKRLLKDVFEDVGLTNVVQEGLPAEKRTRFLEFEDEEVISVEYSAFDNDIITFSSDGELISTGIRSLLGLREKIQDAYKDRVKSLFSAHVHPSGITSLSFEDMEYMIDSGVPELIVTPDGKAKLWFLYRRDKFKELVNGSKLGGF